MNQDQDIIEEIKSEMLREKILYLFQTYFKQIIGMILAIVMVYALYIYWQHRKIESSQKYAMIYQQTFVDRQDANQETFESFIKQANGTSYAELATLKYAEFLNQKHQPNEAIKKLLLLSTSSNHLEIANLALINAAQTVIKYNLNSTETIDQLSKVKDKDSPYFVLLKLMLAQIYLDNNEVKHAQDAISTLQNLEMTPQTNNLFNILNHSIKTKNL